MKRQLRFEPSTSQGAAAVLSLAVLLSFAPASAQDRAPQAVGSIPARTVATGQSASVDLSPYFSDADGDALAYAATVSDAAIATVSVSGSVLTIEGVAAGTAIVAVFASDPGGLSATQRTEVAVSAPNRAPEAVGTIPTQTLTPGQWAAVSVSSYFRDPDGETLSFSATSSDAAVASVTVAGDIVTITQAGTGTATINVVARDAGGLSVRQGIAIAADAGSGQVESTPARPTPERPPPVQSEPAPRQRTQPAAPATSETLLRYQSEKRSEAIALGLEWLIPVVGHAYAGDASAGLLPAGVTLGGAALMLGGVASCIDIDSCEGGAAVAVLGGFVSVIGGRIWGMASAYGTAARTNRELRQRLGIQNVVGSLIVTPDPLQGRYRVGMALRF